MCTTRDSDVRLSTTIGHARHLHSRLQPPADAYRAADGNEFLVYQGNRLPMVRFISREAVLGRLRRHPRIAAQTLRP